MPLNFSYHEIHIYLCLHCKLELTVQQCFQPQKLSVLIIWAIIDTDIDLELPRVILYQHVLVEMCSKTYVNMEKCCQMMLWPGLIEQNGRSTVIFPEPHLSKQRTKSRVGVHGCPSIHERTSFLLTLSPQGFKPHTALLRDHRKPSHAVFWSFLQLKPCLARFNIPWRGKEGNKIFAVVLRGETPVNFVQTHFKAVLRFIFFCVSCLGKVLAMIVSVTIKYLIRQSIICIIIPSMVL